MPGSLILVRHGQSLWNLENRFTGWVDIGITDHGQEEARSAGRKLQHLSFHQAYTSNLIRAHHTLELILETTNHTHLPIERHEALNERHYGELQGLNKEEVARQHGAEQVQRWRRSFDIRPPGGESLADTVARVQPFLETRLLPAARTQNILVVAHGNSIRAVCMIMERLSPEQIIQLEIGHCEPLAYHLDDQGRVQEKILLQ